MGKILTNSVPIRDEQLDCVVVVATINRKGQMTVQDEIAAVVQNRRGRPPRFTAEQRADRAKLAARAQSIATAALRRRYSEQYAELYEEAKKEVGLD